MTIQTPSDLLNQLIPIVLQKTREENHIKAIYNANDPEKKIQTNETQRSAMENTVSDDIVSESIKRGNIHKYERLVLDICDMQGVTGIDKDSIENIALALKNVKIQSVDTIIKMNLKIIKPGPLFYSWTAMNCKSLYNGKNNDREINYVESLKKESKFLGEHGIPVFIAYSKKNSAPSYAFEMEEVCKANSNVIFISLENDLNIIEGYDEYVECITNRLILNDSLRQFVIFNYKQVLDICKLRCAQKNKTTLLKRFTDIGCDSITYTDFDNIHLNSIGYSLAKHGMHSSPCIYIDKICEHIKSMPAKYECLSNEVKLMMSEILTRCEYLPRVGELCTKSNSWYEMAALKLYRYLGGIDIQALLIEMKSNIRSLGHEDNSYLRISSESLFLYKGKVKYTNIMVTLLTFDEFIECDLVVYQYMRKLLIGNNATWAVGYNK